MEEQAQEGLKQRRKRNKRVKRLKKAILVVLLGWSFLSMILTVIMLVQIHLLNQKLNTILTGKSQNIQEAQLKRAEKSMNLPEISETKLYDDTNVDDAGENMDETNILASSISLDDTNFAGTGDALKVYLTFDDGPSKNTPKLLDILKKYNVKATFFVLGHEDEDSVKSYQRIINEGHTLAIHSFTHDYKKVYASKESFENDVLSLQNLLYDKTGIRCQFYRFPGGSSNQICRNRISEYTSVLSEHDMTYFDWNISNEDATGKNYSAAQLTQNVLQNVPRFKTSIVLMHDTAEKNTTVESLETLIPSLKEMGVEILPIDKNTTVVQHVHVNDTN